MNARGVALLLPMALVGVCLVVPACTEGGASGGGAGMPDARFVAGLKDRAHEVARAEIRRLAEAERQYRDEVTRHQFVGPMGNVAGGYLKMYREFTGYTVVDIRRSESYLYPTVFEIDLAFDDMATPLRHTDLDRALPGVNPRQVAAGDTEFSPRRQLQIRRSFLLDAEGSIVQRDDPLPRPKYYEPHGDRREEEPEVKYSGN